MPANLNFELYLNIIFLAAIGWGFIVGYFRGLRKSVYSLITTVLFFGFFFVSLEFVVNQLWTADMSFVLPYIETYAPTLDLGGATNLGDIVFGQIELRFGEQLGTTLENEIFIDFVTGVTGLILKIVYVIIYFTLGKVIYTIFTFFFRVIFIRNKKLKRQKPHMKHYKKKKSIDVDGETVTLSKRQRKKMYKKDLKAYVKEKKRAKKRLAGAGFGALKGAFNAFLTVILLGGLLSFSESALSLLPEEMNSDLIDLPAETLEQVAEVEKMITAFNNNFFVQGVSAVTIEDPAYGEEIPAHLYLFDTVLSFEFQEQRISLRQEFDLFAGAGSSIVNSEYMSTNNVSDITGAEVQSVFVNLSKSNLVTTAIPLGIEVGSDYFDTPVEIPVEELYAIDWESELATIGAIAATGFDLINTAGLLEDEPDYETIELNGEDVNGIFIELSNSELATLGAYVAIEPLLQQAGSDVQAIITVPTDLVWEDEYKAFGEVAEAVLNTGITVGDLQSNDTSVLIGGLSEMDFTVLLQSQIVSHALKNVFSGEAGIEGLDIIVVPDEIVWFDEYDSAGNLIYSGELRNILTAVNEIADVAADFNFDDISLDVISDFDDDAIDALFDSDILVASISDFLLNMDLGDTPLVIPNTALDENDYLLSSELKNIANSARVLATELQCDEGDTACEEEYGFDIEKAFSLSDDNIDTLTSSEILSATLGKLILDNAGDIITVPSGAMNTVTDNEGITIDVVSKLEIKKMFQAVNVLGFTDLENMEFDASIVQNIALEEDVTQLDTSKSATLFGSDIIHATLSTMLFEQAEGVDSVLAVPYFSENLDEIRTLDETDGIEYLSKDELDDILQAFLILNIQNFNEVDSLDLNMILDNANVLLESSILHATISKQVLDLTENETMSAAFVVPYFAQDDTTAIRVTVGDELENTNTTYIAKAEITSMLDGLQLLGIDDVTTFDGSVDLNNFYIFENRETLLGSSIMQATLSKQLIDLQSSDILAVPSHDVDGNEVLITSVNGAEPIEYVSKAEIHAMFEGLELLNIQDINTFDGNVTLDNFFGEVSQDTLLGSATMHATISKQMYDLNTDGTITIPVQDVDTNPVQVTVNGTDYITKDEIKAIINGIEVLGFNDVQNLTGSFDINSFNDTVTQDTLLSSASIHATISKQLTDLDTDGTLSIPTLDVDSNPVQVVVSGTTFVTKHEIKAIIDSLGLLGIDDVQNMDGNFDINNFTTPEAQDTILSSATIHSTITTQLLDLSGSGTLSIPTLDIDSNPVQVTVGGTNFITKDEIRAIIDSLELLGIDDVQNMDGNFNINNFTTPEAQDTILSSATIHSTITTQLLDLNSAGTLTIPVLDVDGNPIQVTVGGTDFITKDEIRAIIDSLELLGIDDVQNMDGNFNINNFTTPEAQDTILSSATIHLTISTQLLDLDTAGTLTIPDVDIDSNDIKVTVDSKDFITKDEIKAIIDSLELLGIDDVQNMDGNFNINNFTTPEAQDTILSSATIHLTISSQLYDLDTAGTIAIPQADIDSTAVKVTVGGNNFISKVEIKALLDGLDLLGVSDVQNMDGNFDITQFTTPESQDIILASATIHATISAQIYDLGTSGTLVVPDTNVVGTPIKTNVLGTDYITKAEIKAIFDGLDILGINDVQNFGGTFDLTLLQTELAQNTLLSSASIHATISDTLTTLGSGVLIVPLYQENGITPVRTTVSGTEFIVKQEVRALINAFNTMNYTNLDSFGAELNSAEFFNGRDDLLLSSSIQATISDKLLNGTGGFLIIPDTNINTISPVRVVLGDVTYIESSELDAMLDALEELGLTNFATFDASSFDSGNILAADYDTIFLSASMQATVSDKILEFALTETAPPGATLIVPSALREGILVAGVAGEHIQITELKALLSSLNVLGVSDFGGSMNGSTITSLTDTQLDTLLASGSIHTTLDNMLRSNGALTIPTVAETNEVYKSNIITKTELKAFINATNTVTTGGSFTTVTFDIAGIVSLDASGRDTVATSLIVRRMLTPTLELAASNPLDPYTINNTDYENDDPLTQVLKKASFLAIVTYYYG